MRKNIKEELKAMSVEQLRTEAEEIRKAIFAVRMQKIAAPVKNTNLVRTLRKHLARALTFLQQVKA